MASFNSFIALGQLRGIKGWELGKIPTISSFKNNCEPLVIFLTTLRAEELAFFLNKST